MNENFLEFGYMHENKTHFFLKKSFRENLVFVISNLYLIM